MNIRLIARKIVSHVLASGGAQEEMKKDRRMTPNEAQVLIEKLKSDPDSLNKTPYKDFQETVSWSPSILKEIGIEKLMGYLKNQLKKTQGVSEPTWGAMGMKPLKITDKEMQKKLIEVDPRFIDFILSPGEDIKLMAIKKNPDVIRGMTGLSEEAMIEALKHDPMIIKNLDKPTEKVWDFLIDVAIKDPKLMDKIPFPKNVSIKLHRQLMEKDPKKLFHVDKEDLARLVKSPADLKRTLKYVKEPSKELQMEIVKNDPMDLKEIKNPVLEVQEYALNQIVKSKKKDDILEFAESTEFNPVVQKRIFDMNWTYAVNLKNPSADIERQVKQLTEMVNELEDRIDSEKDSEKKKELNKLRDELEEGDKSKVKDIHNVLYS